MIKKIEKLNHKNRQKYDIKYRDYKLFIKILITFSLLWLLSSLYYQFCTWNSISRIQENSNIVNNKNFYYLLYVHGILFSSLIFTTLKQYEKKDFFWKVSKNEKYISYLIYFIPSYVILILFLIILQQVNFISLIISMVVVTLSNILSINLRLTNNKNIEYISFSLLIYIILALMVKVPNFLNFLNISWISNVIFVACVIISIFLTYKRWNEQPINLQITWKLKRTYKSNLNIYFLNILRKEKIIPNLTFIIGSILINSYFFKKNTNFQIISTAYDYVDYDRI